MTNTAYITRAMRTATPSVFSTSQFVRILVQLRDAITLEHTLRNLQDPDHPEFSTTQETSITAWYKTNSSAQAFLRCHVGETSAPALVTTIHDLLELFAFGELDQRPVFDIVSDAMKRCSKLPGGSESKALLEKAIPLFYQVAQLQAQLSSSIEEYSAA